MLRVTLGLALLAIASVALARAGVLVWQDELDHAAWFDRANDVAIDGNRAVVVGLVNNDAFFTAGDFLVRTYALRSGRLLWDGTFDAAGRYDEAYAVSVAEGVAYVAGYTTDETFNTDLIVRAYGTRRGDLLWDARFDGGPSDLARAVVTDGTAVYAAGQTDAGGPMDFLVVALDAATGERLWVDRYDRSGADDRARDLALGAGRLFVVGTGEATAGQADGLIRTYEASTGTLLWQRHIDVAGGFDAATAVVDGGECAIPAGRTRPCVHLAGSVTNAAGNSDFHVRTYDAGTGALLWKDSYDPDGGYDSADTVAVGDGMLFVGGGGTRPGRLDGHIVRAYDPATGALIWETRRESRTDGMAVKDLAVGSGTVYSVGSGVKKRFPDYLVRAYSSATGALQWEDRFDLERRSDSAEAVAFARGRVISAGTGTRRPPERNFNMLVRTYRTR